MLCICYFFFFDDSFSIFEESLDKILDRQSGHHPSSAGDQTGVKQEPNKRNSLDMRMIVVLATSPILFRHLTLLPNARQIEQHQKHLPISIPGDMQQAQFQPHHLKIKMTL